MVAAALSVQYTIREGLNADMSTQMATTELQLKLSEISQQQTSMQSGQSPTPTSDGHQALRRALLLVKAACLHTSLGVEVAGLHLWRAAESAAAASAADLAPLLSHSGQADSDNTEAQSLTTLLVQLLVPTLKKLVKVKSEPAGIAVCCCCRILKSLLPASQPVLYRAAAVELISSGEISVPLHRTSRLDGAFCLGISSETSGQVAEALAKSLVLIFRP